MEETRWRRSVEEVPVGIYGWRKRCLYLLLLILVLVAIVNATLVFWLMTVLYFNTSGMNYMTLVEGGIQLTGKTYVQDTLVASRVFTRLGQAMAIHCANNLTLRNTDTAGSTTSNIYLEDGVFEIRTPVLKVTNDRGHPLLIVDKDSVSYTIQPLQVSGEGGSVLNGSLQSPIISADISSDLTLESSNMGVQVVTPAGVSIESRAGSILADSHEDINLITVDGSIKLESGSVLMPSLAYGIQRPRYHRRERIYQLCVCSNGELFLGEPDGLCETSPNSGICD